MVTFNNPPLARFAAPPATCVEIPCKEMGVEAGRLLLERLERPGETEPQVRMLPGRLVIRDSAGPAIGKRQ